MRFPEASSAAGQAGRVGAHCASLGAPAVRGAAADYLDAAPHRSPKRNRHERPDRTSALPIGRRHRSVARALAFVANQKRRPNRPDRECRSLDLSPRPFLDARKAAKAQVWRRRGRSRRRQRGRPVLSRRHSDWRPNQPRNSAGRRGTGCDRARARICPRHARAATHAPRHGPGRADPFDRAMTIEPGLGERRV